MRKTNFDYYKKTCEDSDKISGKDLGLHRLPKQQLMLVWYINVGNILKVFTSVSRWYVCGKKSTDGILK